MPKADIGLIGLAVMGENLILNMASKGFTVACFNRTVSKVDDFLNSRAKGKNIIGCKSISELAASLKTPRKIMLMVKAGKAVDDFIDQLLPCLDNGDIIIDGGIALMWRGGCIIRSAFLDKIKQAFDANPALVNLLLDPFFKEALEKAQNSWRRVVVAAVEMGIPMPAVSAALAYYDGYRHERLPANLLQAQRDYFGAHTYERIDKPRGEFFHTNWTGRGGSTASSTYNA